MKRHSKARKNFGILSPFPLAVALVNPNPRKMSRNWAIIAILLLLAGLTFSEVRHFGFVSYDDPDYITGNRLVQQGITREGLTWAFGQLHGSKTYLHPTT